MTPAPGGRVFGRGRFRMASAIGLRHPASASCLGRHLRLAGRCPNNSSLFPPLAAVVVVALWTSSAERLFLFRNSGKSADFPELPFHRRGRNGKQHLQRRFLRKRGAAQAVTERVPSPFCEKNYRIWQSRQAKTGKSAPLLTLTN